MFELKSDGGNVGDKLASVLIAVYLVMSLVYLYERKPWKALYWISAAMITLSVRNMK